MNEKIEIKEGDAPGTCSNACVFAFHTFFASPTTHPLITATHLPFLPSLPPHCHSPLSSRLALTSQLASPSFRASAVSSHCLLSSSLSHRLSSLGHIYLPSPPSASCPPIVHLCLKKEILLPFHVNLSPLASALLAVSPRPTTSQSFVIAYS
jgi:hypothetical protein